MAAATSKIQETLQGKWIMMHTEHKHYMIFKGNIYQSRHRHGTFTIEQDDDGAILLEMSDAHHSRILHIIDHNTFTMEYSIHGTKIKSEYRRDHGLIGKIQRLKIKA